MRFYSLCTFALSTLASLVAAGENPIVTPASGTIVEAGGSIDVTWKPTTSGKIDLVLRYGPTANLLKGNRVASQIENTGAYTWNIPTNIGNGEWSIAITTGKDADTNYSPMFTVTGGTGKQGSAGSTTASAPIKTVANVVQTKASGETFTTSISITVTGKSSTPTGAAVRLGSAGELAAVVGLGALAALV